MNKLSICLLGVLLLTACNNKSTQVDNTDDADTKSAKLKLEKVEFASPDSTMVVLSAEVPVNGGTPLADSIINYISSCIGNNFDLYYKESKDAKTAIRKTGEKRLKEMQEEIAQEKNSLGLQDEEDSYMFAWEERISVSKIDEGESFITFVQEAYDYKGGAHGMNWYIGTTFDKKTGKTIGTNILKNTDSQNFKTLFRQKLLDYFEPSKGETLADYLLVNVEDVSLSNMFFAKGKFIFIYQPYEISYYAAGMPCVEFSLKEMKPFLTEQGLKLIKKQ